MVGVLTPSSSSTTHGHGPAVLHLAQTPERYAPPASHAANRWQRGRRRTRRPWPVRRRRGGRPQREKRSRRPSHRRGLPLSRPASTLTGTARFGIHAIQLAAVHARFDRLSGDVDERLPEAYEHLGSARRSSSHSSPAPMDAGARLGRTTRMSASAERAPGRTPRSSGPSQPGYDHVPHLRSPCGAERRMGVGPPPAHAR